VSGLNLTKLKSEISNRYLILDNILSTRDFILVFSDWDTFSLFACKVTLKCLEAAPDNTGVTLIGFAIVFKYSIKYTEILKKT
jgi:hypothetical protein